MTRPFLLAHNWLTHPWSKVENYMTQPLTIFNLVSNTRPHKHAFCFKHWSCLNKGFYLLLLYLLTYLKLVVTSIPIGQIWRCMPKHTKHQEVKRYYFCFPAMCFIIKFITAICVLFLVKLRWPIWRSKYMAWKKHFRRWKKSPYLRSESVNLVSTTFEILNPAHKPLSVVSSQPLVKSSTLWQIY